MAVSLWDMMRPVALLGGVSAAAAPHLAFGVAPAIASGSFGLAAGLAAFGVSGAAARRMSHDASNASLCLLYLAAFLAIAAAGFFGGQFGAWTLHAIA